MAAAKKLGALTMIHAENNAMINWMSEKLIKGSHKEPKYHALSHPRTAESEAINRAVALSSFIDTASPPASSLGCTILLPLDSRLILFCKAELFLDI